MRKLFAELAPNSIQVVKEWTRIRKYLYQASFGIISLWSCLFCASGFGQEYTSDLQKLCLPAVLHFSPSDYQAQRQNWSIAQNPQTRFMYVGNSKGLLEYDGNTWKNYILPQRQIIRSVAVADNRIYTGALGEFGYWKADSTGTLKYQTLTHLQKDKRYRHEEIWNILPMQDAVYFHSFAYLYRYQNNQITTLRTPGNVFFAFQVDNRLFVQIFNKGLYEWIDEQFVFIKGSEFLGKEWVRSILKAEANQLQIGTDRALYLLGNNGFVRQHNPASQFLAVSQLNKAIRVDEHTYVYGSVLNGAIITDEYGQIRSYLNQKTGLQNNTILALCLDTDGNVWTGTDSGIDALLFSSPVRHYRDQTGVLGTVYDAALFENQLYVGTNHGVFKVENSESGPHVRMVAGSQGQVWDLEVIDGKLFCGHNEGTFILEGNSFRQLSNLTGGLVLHALTQHPEVLIQGTYTDLGIYQKEKGQWKFSHTIAGDFALTDEILEFKEGTLWIKQKYRGIRAIKLSPDLRKITSDVFVRGFPDASLTEVAGQPVITTSKQSYYLQDFKLKPVSLLGNQGVKNIFPIDYKSYVVLRSSGSLAYWVPGQRIAELNLQHVQWVEGYENIVSLDPKTLLICGDDGFSVVPVSYISQGIKLPYARPNIRQITTEKFTQTLYPNQPQQELKFKYWQNNLSITFASTQYEANLSYQYLIEGEMKEWSAFTKNTELNTGPLEPGSYVLRIRSSVSSEETVLPFIVRPPWYWNIWSQLVYLLILVVGVWMTYQVYLKRIQTHQRRIQSKMQEQLEEEQRRNEQNLTEIRNEQLRKDVERKSEELANSAMNMLHKNELLETIKGELEKLRKEMGPDSGTKQYRSLVQLIDRNLADEHSWDIFESNFNDVHDYFFKKLLESYPNLTSGDLKLAAYLRMNLSSKEIAQLLNITVRSVELKRYRLRGKLTLPTEQNLNEFLIKI